MASLVICMQLRYLFHEFQRRFKRHQNYRRVVSSMEARFPMATSEELQRNSDDCAICWEKMESGRKLPCGHIFHNACLRSWLEQDTSCPTCRMSLSDLNQNTPVNNTAPGNEDIPPAQTARRRQRFTNRFHFDGSRYISWLPSFSVEVTHMLGGYAYRRQQLQTSQFDNMARQVRDVFPSIPLSVIIDDLHITNSVELTIDNIVEGRLTISPDFTGDGRVVEPIVDEMIDDGEDDTNFILADDDNDGIDTAAPLPLSEHVHSTTPLNLNPSVPPSSSAQHQPSSDDVSMPGGSGGRFSKSSAERETMLALRKESMLDQARRRYIARESHQQTVPSTNSGPVSLTTRSVAPDSPEQRRELVYHAIQRRLNPSN